MKPKIDSISLDNRDVSAAQDVLDYLIKRNHGGIAQYSVVGVGYETVKLTNTACIAMLTRYEGPYVNPTRPIPRLCVYRLIGEGYEDSLTSSRLRFLDYLINRSFAKVCYVLPQHFNPKKNQTVVTRCDVPHNLFGFANNLLRIGIENGFHLKAWIRLVDAGVNEDLAFLMCEYRDLTTEGGLVSFGERYNWSHSVMSTNSNTGFADILKGKKAIIETFGDLSYSEKSNYDVQDKLNRGESILGIIKRKLTNNKVEIAEVKDLMGDVTSRAKISHGFTVNDLNAFWEDY